MEARSTCMEVSAPDRQESIGRAASLTERPAGLYSIGDRSATSHRNRSTLDEMRSRPEVNGRIKSILGSVQMTKRQAEEIMTRIREGYYLRPEILHAVAAVICTVLESEA